MSAPTSASARRPLRGLLAVGFVAILLGAPTAIQAQEPPKDPREEREQVREQRAEMAAQVDALEAENAEVLAALADLDADVTAQKASLADAEAVADTARSDAELAVQRVADTEALLAELEAVLRDLAVTSYVMPPADQAMSALERTTAVDAETRKALLALQTGDAADVIDQMKETRARLEAEREEADARAREAEHERDIVKARTEELEAAYQRQATFAAEVEARLDARLSESAALAELDAELSQEIARQEAELAAKLKAQEEARQEAARKAGAAAAAARTASASTSGASSIPIPTDGEIVNVRGINIHQSIAAQLDALLAAAEADGLILGGGGWRSSASQIALRKAHCGTSHYVIYQASASSCSPPTARPGASMHERGLAIDFTCNGGTAINSRSSPCYQWLAAHAADYGLHNLPSEPWHWSINGN